MNQYRLLRDNKESGPYSEEDIIAKGFKPYDLIWVEGKSAGWRYPSEIPALKSFAPVVEEQPYDRFFKKPSPSTPVQEPASTQLITRQALVSKQEIKAPPVMSAPPAKNNPVVFHPMQAVTEKHIHIELPTEPQKKESAKEIIAAIEGNILAEKEPAAKILQPEVRETAPIPKVAAERTSVSIQPKPAETKDNYIVSETAIPDYKSATVAGHRSTVNANAINHATGNPIANQPIYFQQRSDFSWTMVLGLFIGIASFVGLGIMIGRSMVNEKNATNVSLKSTEKSEKPAINNHENPVAVPVADNGASQSQPVLKTVEPREKDLVSNAAVKTNVNPGQLGANNPKQGLPKETGATENNLQQKQNNITKADALSASQMEKLLNVTMNGYKVGAFGGISDLQCTLFNASHLPVDMVDVEVQYVQSNDKVFKTEKLSFKDIPAGGQVTLVAPKSSRGIKVITKIIKIYTRDTGLNNTTVKS
jgi:hypothetical protein